MLHRVHALVIGFQSGKPEACRDGLMLYFLSETGSPERDCPTFLVRLADLLLDLVQPSDDMVGPGANLWSSTIARGDSDGAGELLSHAAQAVVEGPLTTHQTTDNPLGWAVQGAGDSEETEEGASGVPEVLVASQVPATKLVVESHQKNVGVLFTEAEVSSQLGPTYVRRNVNMVLTVEPRLGDRSKGSSCTKALVGRWGRLTSAPPTIKLVSSAEHLLYCLLREESICDCLMRVDAGIESYTVMLLE
ncbi:hypothetical protein BHM03_00024928 [Ensete ventricosum]|nr:hypothetical protein BHM03_00024928 [Ensete ventricosum]